jgi:hypothetical protein
MKMLCWEVNGAVDDHIEPAGASAMSRPLPCQGRGIEKRQPTAAGQNKSNRTTG